MRKLFERFLRLSMFLSAVRLDVTLSCFSIFKKFSIMFQEGNLPNPRLNTPPISTESWKLARENEQLEDTQLSRSLFQFCFRCEMSLLSYTISPMMDCFRGGLHELQLTGYVSWTKNNFPTNSSSLSVQAVDAVSVVVVVLPLHGDWYRLSSQIRRQITIGITLSSGSL